MTKMVFATAMVAALLGSSAASALDIKPYFLNKLPAANMAGDTSNATGPVTASGPFVTFGPSAATTLVSGFEATSDYDTRALGIGLIPPDTNGAVGRTQYVEIINGSFSVYNKATGLLAAPRITDSTFWQAAGGQATGGDPRLLFDKRTDRWLAIGFNANGSGLQIATSNSNDALGGWKASQFGTFTSPGAFRSLADFPTLAISGNSVIVSTNNFAQATSATGFSFKGTTINVLNRGDIFKAAGPDVSTAKQFVNPFTGTAADVDRGFAIQGVNRDGGSSTANLVAVSLVEFDQVGYNITNAGAANAALTAVDYQNATLYNSPSPARQPTAGPSARVLSANDERIASSVFEIKGRYYYTQTVKLAGSDHDVVRVTVVDAATNTILSETNIGQSASNAYDYYFGSLAVNAAGQVVVGYNRSGDITTGIGGRVSIFAKSFNTNADGTLTATSGEIFIKQSLTDEYHNGSREGAAPVGRQRFGDYSAVSVDPTDMHRFWVIGEFAREPNTLANHPEGSGSGFHRWGTYVGQIGIAAVPEPATWGLMILGFGLVGAQARRRRSGYATA